MGSNTHEYLATARMEIDAAIKEERSGPGASESIIKRIAKAQQELARAKEHQRSMLAFREPRPILSP